MENNIWKKKSIILIIFIVTLAILFGIYFLNSRNSIYDELIIGKVIDSTNYLFWSLLLGICILIYLILFSFYNSRNELERLNQRFYLLLISFSFLLPLSILWDYFVEIDDWIFSVDQELVSTLPLNSIKELMDSFLFLNIPFGVGVFLITILFLLFIKDMYISSIKSKIKKA
ncbi:hypothetical protein [Flammeovirga sp. EKP202]|uniref:hypothetical protein n=1 Tax=Flammeovirga sp. EKP202 TaxID=2770592 RepID=UPI00165F89F6|nr:hypothetical protein [Flammeovirga sp. EKP202]MBD0405315.1 hypothetical protein [Flammeovirga sp. EKP202]